MADPTAQDRIWLPPELDRLEQAVGEWLLPHGPASWRVRRLAARVRRCGGVNRAGQVQAEALALAGAPARLDTIRQHLVERLFDQRRYPAVWAELETAPPIRTRAGTDSGPGASAIDARRAREMAGRP